MGLKFWTPLNGNYVNYGLEKYPDIQYNGTLEANGKIGSCYAFSGKYFRINGNIIGGLDTFTVACWAYLTSTTYQIFTFEYNAYWQFCLHRDYIRIRDSVTGVKGTRLDRGITAIPQNKWVHVAVVYNKGAIEVFQDGVLENRLTGNVNSYINTETTVLCIGADVVNSVSTYPGNCKINDFRVYDNCLSPKEIKELSKGLVLHYKLDENYQVMNNAFAYPTFNTSSASGGWNHWASTSPAATGTYSQNTNKEFIWNKSNTYSHKVSHTNDVGYYICYQSPAFEGGYRSAQAIVKMSDGASPVGNVGISHNANLGTNPPNTFTYLGDGFWLIKHEGFRQDGSNDLVSLYISHNKTVYISEFYLENDRTVCSDILWLNDIVTDVSGYGHHGQIMTGLTTQTDSPRYETCISNSEGYPLKSVFDFPQSNGLTIACWIYLTAWGSQGSGLWSTSTISTSNPSDYAATTCNHCDGNFYLRGTNGTTYNITCGTAAIASNVWNHVVLTHDGENIKVYVNGILKYTKECPTPLIGFKSLFLGYSNAGNLSRQCKGKWSDLRMYATALSDDDVLELYNTSAYIDNLGGLHSFEIIEQSSNILQIENLNEFATSTSNYTAYTTRNGVKAFPMRPNWYASPYATLIGKFKENTQYLFDVWIDTDDVVSENVNRPGGFTIDYTDGSTSTSCIRTGNYSSPIGWQHILVITPAGKTISRIRIYYYTSVAYYFRADSFIAELKNTNIYKNGITETGQFIENTDVAFIGTADFNANRINEI